MWLNELTKKPFSHAPLFTPQILHNHCFQFLLGNTVVFREVEDHGHIIFLFFGGGGMGEGVNKVHYGICEMVNREISGGRPLRNW